MIEEETADRPAQMPDARCHHTQVTAQEASLDQAALEWECKPLDRMAVHDIQGDTCKHGADWMHHLAKPLGQDAIPCLGSGSHALNARGQIALGIADEGMKLFTPA